MKNHEVKDNKKLPLACIDDYFKVQFCNKKLQALY